MRSTIKVGEKYVVGVVDRHCFKSHSAAGSLYMDLCEHEAFLSRQPALLLRRREAYGYGIQKLHRMGGGNRSAVSAREVQVAIIRSDSIHSARPWLVGQSSAAVIARVRGIDWFSGVKKLISILAADA